MSYQVNAVKLARFKTSTNKTESLLLWIKAYKIASIIRQGASNAQALPVHAWRTICRIQNQSSEAVSEEYLEHRKEQSQQQ